MPAPAGSDNLSPTRLAAAVQGPRGWRRAALATGLGALAALALPPFHLVVLLIPAFVGLLWLVDGCRGIKAAAAIGWLFGFGYFLVSLHWLGNAFLVDADRHALVMAPAVLGLAAGMAIFPALASALARFAPGTGWRRLLALAAAWILVEWFRGWFLTGLPWSLVGHAWAVSDEMLQATAVVGVPGLGAMTLLAALSPARVRGRRDLLVVAALFAMLAMLWVGGRARLAAPGPDDSTDHRVRVVQPNIPQRLKWRRDMRQANFARLLALAYSRPLAPGTLVIWPETATPFFLEERPPALRRIAEGLPQRGLALVGSPRRAPGGERRLWNSLLVVAPPGRVVLRYDKQHLVPFGEYLPFRALLGRLGLAKFAAGSIDYSAGPGPRVLRHPDLPELQPLICFEAIFPAERPPERPRWLLNITNDAWFGDFAGPRQHFEISRLRAIERGIPLVRAANTGISAVIDAHGRVRAALPLGEAGVLDEALPSPLPAPPPYGRFGDLTWMPVVVLILILTIAGRRRERANAS